jgi:hypothetical protein
MSNLLQEAIVDANALRETALKNAESAIVDKYSDEVRHTLEQLLEQEGIDDPLAATDQLGLEPEPAPAPALGADMGDPALMGEEPVEEVVDDVPLAATDGFADLEGDNLNKFPAEGEDVEVSVDLAALQEAVEALKNELDEEFEINEEDLADILSEEDDDDVDEPEDAKFDTEEAGGDDDDIEGSSSAEAETATASGIAATDRASRHGLGEEVEISDDLVDAIMEKLTVDMGAELSGWAGRPTSQLKYEQEREIAGLQSDDSKEELEALNKAQEELFAENKQLKEQNTQYKQALQELREGLQDVNLSNARLLYTNRILKNASLNERQKNKIVEAISKAGSVTEARTIYNTLESTVEVIPKKGPQSLSEAITRRSSVIHASRQENEKQPSDSFSLRMKRLAGIKS